jgi:putative acetyltransferase
MLIRPEKDLDQTGVRAVNLAAFETAAEADLVDILHDQVQPIISLIAELEGKVIGHIMFSPVYLSADPSLQLMGLAPMAVLPEFQHGGVGSKLVAAGLECRKRDGVAAVVVLGHPQYYPRFGFLPAVEFEIDCEYEVPAEVFMELNFSQERLLENPAGCSTAMSSATFR